MATLPIALFLLAAWLLGVLAWGAGVFSLAFALVSLASGLFLLRRRRSPGPSPDFPPVTILKPLKGEDRELYENLASFCRLDYPRLQIVFTLASPEDPALAAVLRLRRDFPGLDIEVVVSKNRIGLNPKINNLSNSAPFVKHDLILMSDSDIRVRPDLLRRMLAPLRDPRVGLVTCFYRSTPGPGLWAGLEALSVNAHFLPQALTAAAFGMRFAMGAAILVRREAFERSGGFKNLAAHLADDFILGESVQAAGYRLEYADAVVDSIPETAGGREHLRHQVRWARTIRICRPAGYLGSLLLHGFSLLCLKLALFGFEPGAAALALGVLGAKALALCLGRLLDGKPSQGLASLALLPLSEWIAFGAWLAGFGSSQVLWRGELYSVEPRGRLSPVPPVRSPLPAEP